MAQTNIIDVRDEQPRYSTNITEYKYSRKSPGSAVQRDVVGVYRLPLPVSIPDDRYSADTNDFNLAEVGTTLDILREGSVGQSIGELIGIAGTATVVGTGLATAISTLVGKSKKSTDAASGALDRAGAILGSAAVALPFVGAYGGVVRNPHTALLFNKMNLRDFNLTFKISPRNQQQSREVDFLIKRLKVAMHPSYNDTFGRYALDYPSLFRVEFNPLPYEGYPKIDFSFMTSFDVSISEQGNVMYRDGYPAFFTIKMNLKEIDMKTRESFGVGGQQQITTSGLSQFEQQVT